MVLIFFSYVSENVGITTKNKTPLSYFNFLKGDVKWLNNSITPDKGSVDLKHHKL